VQGLGLEWLHRLALEPKRLARRYLVDDMLIFSMFLRHLLSPSSSSERRMRSR
jgi:N-acetylglucosaminyldiphosphoundecaprenol N-acetyl-beta-D-mannosaminyltransferase